MSDAPTGRPSVEQYADNLIPVLDALGLDRAVVAGHHTGAAIAASFAARHPDRTAGVLLHGVPLYTEEERAARLSTPERSRALTDDDRHLSDYYGYIRRYAGPHPRGAVTANWSTILWYLAGVADVAHEAVFCHDLAADLRRLSGPVMILSDAGDTLHPNDLRAASLYPEFRLVTFSEGGAHSLMLDPARWAGIATDFVGGIPASPRAP